MNHTFMLMLCIWDGGDGCMLMNRLQNIFQRLIHNYFVQLIGLTVIILLIVFSLLESKEGEITFIYNNF